MQLSLNKQSALQAIRAIRCGKAPQVNRAINYMARVSLRSPQRPDGKKRWSPATAHLDWLGLPQPSQRAPLHVAVPTDANRIRARFFSSTIYSAGLPDDAFLDIGHGIQIASPELLFVELATVMIPQVLVLLGYELTGKYSRDAGAPRLGPITYGVSPLTTVEKIENFIARCHGIPGLCAARECIKYVSDNSWSPTESLIAAMAALPIENLGYGLGRLTLNERSDAGGGHAICHEKGSRVPDMLVPKTPVGINYEGGGHLELDRIVAAATVAAENPGSVLFQDEVAHEKNQVREKYVDDLRRTRELASRGLVIVNATMEDLFVRYGLDTLMQQVIRAAERFSDRDFSLCWKAFDSPAVCDRRQLLIWALLDWKPGVEYMRQFMAQEYSAPRQAIGDHTVEIVL
ncbi:hypothetical protein [Olsenella sp. kh2p3]|jgi:hypothetical protein|uniref:hypothetical protein n=1 Tax=Olsenella sp. kh2p3 TaxID=1797112 RepID=UPI00091EEBBB|nr:hypothetical protein [Olsenella sp. kh2p3]SFX41509.1 hypothetical protein SAMN04487823_10547 [Olsenella sp. kh2p3]